MHQNKEFITRFELKVSLLNYVPCNFEKIQWTKFQELMVLIKKKSVILDEIQFADKVMKL